MSNKQPQSIWDINPWDGEALEYADFEQLFMLAYEYQFLLPASPVIVWPYLNRYFRFRVVPPWLREYIRVVLHGEAIANIGNAPLDPAFDWRQIQRWLVAGLPRARGERGDKPNSYFKA
jgi:hypothetical protein